MATTIPFGLTLLDPVPLRLMASRDQVVVDQQTRLPVFIGRPLGEASREELLALSSPTEKDGQDPIAVDSDPFYD